MSTIIEALSDPALFSGMFDAPSWRPWRAFLAALFALPMDAEALTLYRHHTGRHAPPIAPFREAGLVCGRRGGKSRTLAVVATWLATVPDYSPYIAPGETPVVAIIAADRRQARVILGYITGLLRAVPALAPMIDDVLAESVRLTNGITIEVHTGSIGAPRGRTYIAVLLDEVCFWGTGDVANPDTEVVNAVRPGLASIPTSVLLMASSPYARRGVLFNAFARYFGKDEAPVLIWRGTTREMNSNIPQSVVDEAFAADPDSAASEYGAEWRSDIVGFITREAIEATVAAGVLELPSGGGIAYAGFVDPSGGSADSMTLAIAHLGEDGIAVLDALREVRPPFSPDDVVRDFASLLKAYGISRVMGDNYGGEWPKERFSVHGITYDPSKKTKNTIYGEFLPALNGRRMRLLDHPRMIAQFCGLERRVARGGRDSVDHGPGQHDDVANAAAGALVQVISDRVPALIRSDDLLVAGEAVPNVRVCDGVFATLWTDQRGMTAVVYAAVSKGHGIPLVFVDFDFVPLSAALFRDVAARLVELAVGHRARRGAIGLFVPPELVRHAAVTRVRVRTPPPEMLQDIGQLKLSAAAHVVGGRVKLGVTTMEKSRHAPFSGALNFQPGADADEDPIRLASIIAIAVALDGRN